jgi:hypothetical protein
MLKGTSKSSFSGLMCSQVVEICSTPGTPTATYGSWGFLFSNHSTTVIIVIKLTTLYKLSETNNMKEEEKNH